MVWTRTSNKKPVCGTVGKISAFERQGYQFDPGSAGIKYCTTYFPPKLAHLSILLRSVNVYQSLLGANQRWISVSSSGSQLSSP